MSRRLQGLKEKINDYLTNVQGLITMLNNEVPMVEQLDWAYRGLRSEFKKAIRKFDFRAFIDLVSWETTWTAAKEY